MIRKLTRILTLLILALSLALAACRPATSEEEPGIPLSEEENIIVTDMMDREVVFDEPPQRIVLAGRSNFMLNDIVYLFPEAPERVVALTRARQQTLDFMKLLDAGAEEKMRFTIDSSAEEIAAVNPDLVLLKTFTANPLGDALEELEIPVVYLGLETPEQYQRDLAILGQIFVNTERAQELARYFSAVVGRLREATSELAQDERPRVLVIQASEEEGAMLFKVPSSAWIQTQLVAQAGGEPVWKDAAEGGGWSVVNFEQIAVWDPEYVFVINYFGDVEGTVAQLRASPEWQALPAVTEGLEGSIYAFPKDYYSWDQPDTRWALGADWLASRLHPDEYEIDMEDAFYLFYAELYGLDRETIAEHIVPRVEGDVEIE